MKKTPAVSTKAPTIPFLTPIRTKKTAPTTSTPHQSLKPKTTSPAASHPPTYVSAPPWLTPPSLPPLPSLPQTPLTPPVALSILVNRQIPPSSSTQSPPFTNLPHLFHSLV